MVEKKKREHGNVKNKGQKRRNKATRGMRERERERERWFVMRQRRP